MLLSGRCARWQSVERTILCVGSQTGGRAATATLLKTAKNETAKLNGVGPQVWLVDTLAHIPASNFPRVGDLLPSNAPIKHSSRPITLCTALAGTLRLCYAKA